MPRADRDFVIQDAAKTPPCGEESNSFAQVRSLGDRSKRQQEEIVVLKTQIAALMGSVKVLPLRLEFLAACNRNEGIGATVGVIWKDVTQLMEITGNAPAAVVEPTTRVEELLSKIKPHLEQLEPAINAAAVSAIAEVRTESETVLEPAGRRGKSTSRKSKKSRKARHHSDSSGSNNWASEDDGRNSEH